MGVLQKNVKKENALCGEERDAFDKLAGKQGNIGNIHFRYKALNAYKESISVFTIQYPQMYAHLLSNIGSMYQNMAMYDQNIRFYTNQAVESFQEALKVYVKEKFPQEFADTKYNIGVAYMKLSDVECTEENRNVAISSFQEALGVYNLSDYPEQYANAQMNLGNVHLPLIKRDFNALDCKNAIHAYDEAIKVFTLEGSKLNYAMLYYSKGLAYSKLAGLEDRVKNCKNAISSFNEALKVINQNNHYGIYRSIKEIVHSLEPCDRENK